MVKTKFFSILASLVLLSSCSVLPSYQFKSGEQTARIKLFDMGQVSICKNGKFYQLNRRVNKNTVLIPSGQRISIGYFLYRSLGNYSYSCYPMISFVPIQNKLYYAHMRVEGKRCMFYLVKDNPNSPTGVQLDTSVAPAYCK